MHSIHFQRTKNCLKIIVKSLTQLINIEEQKLFFKNLISITYIRILKDQEKLLRSYKLKDILS